MAKHKHTYTLTRILRAGRRDRSRNSNQSNTSRHSGKAVAGGGTEHSTDKACPYHEVEVKPITDPVTDEIAFLVMQRDVTEQVALENLLSELTEDQLAMLSQVGGRRGWCCSLVCGAIVVQVGVGLVYMQCDVTEQVVLGSLFELTEDQLALLRQVCGGCGCGC